MMRRLLLLGLFCLLGCIGMLGAVSGSSAASPPGWGDAADLPGMAALNVGGYGIVNSVSCAAAGDCTAGGAYDDGSANSQAFVIDETNGSWGSAIEVPGTASLNSGGYAILNSVSCPAAGSCAAGGSYADSSGNSQAFVVDETNGTWGTAVEVPGTAALNSGGNAVVNSVSCATAGNCTAGGTYIDGSGSSQAFVANETNGSWSKAIEVPGTASLNGGGYAVVNSVSCRSAGTCTAGGEYTDGSGHSQAFVADETNGTWGTATEVPGTATLNSGGSGDLVSVSCASAGNCAAGGYYRDGSGHDQAFVVDETNGSWGTAIEVPGTGTLNSGGAADLISMSCAGAGNCTAGGYYRVGTSYESFAVTETSGSWGTAIEVPGTDALNSGGTATVQSVSCATAGTCSAAGTYIDGNHQLQAFVVDETNGSWDTATEIPGTDTLGDTANVSSVSCPAAGSCTAGGSYSSGHGGGAFIVSSGASSKVDQTIQVSTPAPATAVFGTGFSVAATGGGSGNPIVYGSSGGCTNSGASYTMTSGSTNCTVTYDQAGNANYNAATEVTEHVTAQKAAQTITVTTHAPAAAVYGSSFGVSASAPGGTVSFSSAGACSNVGATFTMTSGTGTCSVLYDQAGNSNYTAAAEVTESVTAQKAAQSITFSSLSNHTYGDADFGPGATASSGLAVSYGASGNCSIVAGAVHLTGAGSCTVTASQTGNSNFSAAVPVQQGFSIGKASLLITANDQQKAYGQSLSLGTTAFTPSGLVGSDSISAVTLASSGASAGAAVGSYPIAPSAAVAGNGTSLGNYTVSYANGTLQVKQSAQSINFARLSDRTWGDADFDPGATASSGLPVSYGATGSCAIVGGLVHLTGAGPCTVTASQAGNADYAAATDVPQTFSIAQLPVTVTANDQQKLRGQSLTLGTTAFSTSSLVGSDSISSVTLTSAGAAAGAGAGSYPIVPSAAVAASGTDLNNYAITYSDGTLSVLDAGLVGLNGVSVSTSGGVIDSFDSSQGAYGSANHASSALVLSNGDVSLAGVAVSGDVQAAGTVSLSSTALVSGLVTQSTPLPPIVSPTVSRCASLSKKSGTRHGKFTYSRRTGNLKVAKGTVKLANGTYCFGNLTLAKGSTLVVSGRVTIDLRGKLTAKGHIVNTTKRAANLMVESSSTRSSGVTIAGDNEAYMTILAPGTTVSVSGGSLFGTVLAGTVKVTGKTAIHLDTH